MLQGGGPMKGFKKNLLKALEAYGEITNWMYR